MRSALKPREHGPVPSHPSLRPSRFVVVSRGSRLSLASSWAVVVAVEVMPRSLAAAVVDVLGLPQGDRSREARFAVVIVVHRRSRRIAYPEGQFLAMAFRSRVLRLRHLSSAPMACGLVCKSRKSVLEDFQDVKRRPSHLDLRHRRVCAQIACAAPERDSTK
ncbi:hypothetical protein D9611_014751 [Ephemerocybe angulata]|uniref:Uncharacterized protein n=1 Tax=Ephemerocybe angulata TaxID=980116 RepID=A0A8H5F001_9AGAR|nr:hypothetical protein D9611_014751 [Tulosesus angulatus]